MENNNNRDLYSIIRDSQIIEVVFRENDLCDVFPIYPALQYLPTVRMVNLNQEIANQCPNATSRIISYNRTRITLRPVEMNQIDNGMSFWKAIGCVLFGMGLGSIITKK
jgi:hypothetical protein